MTISFRSMRPRSIPKSVISVVCSMLPSLTDNCRLRVGWRIYPGLDSDTLACGRQGRATRGVGVPQVARHGEEGSRLALDVLNVASPSLYVSHVRTPVFLTYPMLHLTSWPCATLLILSTDLVPFRLNVAVLRSIMLVMLFYASQGFVHKYMCIAFLQDNFSHSCWAKLSSEAPTQFYYRRLHREGSHRNSFSICTLPSVNEFMKYNDFA